MTDSPGSGDGPPLVLVIDDDATVSDVLARYLAKAGLRVRTASDGPEGLAAALEEAPNLVVLDLMLPGMDGVTVCRRLRQSSGVPVVMLTAMGAEADRVLGLEVGADDYVVKPFSPREVVLRVQSVLRRTTPASTSGPGLLVDGDLTLDMAAREARRSGAPLSLTVREFDLLAFLLQHPRQAFSRPELLERVWGWSFGDQSTVTVHVRRLREKVEDDPGSPMRVVTVWGTGYRWEPRAAGHSTMPEVDRA